ncbi:MAG: AlpA family phage regulatory protein [Paracoccus sp. (in: a-proteobacteria)]|uniref:helix-turn-helix transcriptional regulator n=1 Tax=Paracoccus sp. TaxID=267 RepID=UPI0026DFAE89|nr:AlpA family phage regulatory protein [Paracoccus sp. (in: a-proteobacteria)]MDO5632526.1 AlpA family phage regulatory protein [Paracoccus sp. (in: a-proteobacteria)]
MPNIADIDIDTLVDLRVVCRALSPSRASIYRDIARGEFPAPLKIGSSSRWRLSDVRAVVAGTGRA